MKIQTIQTSIKTFLIATISSYFLVSAPLFADTTTTHPTPATNTSTTKSTSTSEQKELHVQNFQDGPLSVQFRYINHVLHYIRFMNTSDNVIALKILGNTYILGKSDMVVINPPKIEYLHYMVKANTGKTDSLDTLADSVLQHRFTDYKTFHMPPKSDERVDLSLSNNNQ